MAKITDPEVVARAASDETPWEGVVGGEVIFQRDCPDCENGLRLAPARFCISCRGTGYLTRTEKR